MTLARGTRKHSSERLTNVPPMPRVSVVISAYNAAVPLPETLRSVQRQTFGDWEIAACR
jgi:cellulose synthase/poly-beta-1,6-N-acetylglucosamine synthase-like glycosyltransferase